MIIDIADNFQNFIESAMKQQKNFNTVLLFWDDYLDFSDNEWNYIKNQFVANIQQNTSHIIHNSYSKNVDIDIFEKNKLHDFVASCTALVTVLGDNIFSCEVSKDEEDEKNEAIQYLLNDKNMYENIETLSDEEKNILWKCDRSGVNGKWFLRDNGEFLLLKASIGKFADKEKYPDIYNRQRKLQQENIIAPYNEGRFIFVKHYFFNSPSGASAVLSGINSNGFVNWKTEDGNIMDDIIDREKRK